MKTPQEVFKLMLEHWDEINHNEFKGICGKLYSMHYKLEDVFDLTFIEFTKAKHFLLCHRIDSTEKFNASDDYRFWWPESCQETRKQFVKYLSEIK